MKKDSIKYLTYAALIAALYVTLTYLTSLCGLASGAIQVRLSEGLCALLAFTPAAIPGLTVGCLLANMLTGCCLLDCICGTFATFIGAYIGYYICRRNKYLVSIPTILANAIIVPIVLIYGYGIVAPYMSLFISVGIGEVISAGVIGTIVLEALVKIGFKL
jgi:uncharacterized membrane protein